MKKILCGFILLLLTYPVLIIAGDTSNSIKETFQINKRITDSFVRQCELRHDSKYILYVASLDSLSSIKGSDRKKFNELYHSGKKLNKAECKILMENAQVIATAYKAQFSD